MDHFCAWQYLACANPYLHHFPDIKTSPHRHPAQLPLTPADPPIAVNCHPYVPPPGIIETKPLPATSTPELNSLIPEKFPKPPALDFPNYENAAVANSQPQSALPHVLPSTAWPWCAFPK